MEKEWFADKVVKVPSKRGPEALRIILDDFDANGGTLSYADYYAEKGEHYFYDLLKHLTSVDDLTPEDFIDWGNTEKYKKEIGIGECAGVVIDLIATLLFESQEKIEKSEELLAEGKWAAAIYYSYTSMVNSAKALLTAEKMKVNTHNGIIKDFQEKFVDTGKFEVVGGFEAKVLQIKPERPIRRICQGVFSGRQALFEKRRRI